VADRLLPVEDDPRIRTALGLGLADQGYEVLEAGSGEAALKLIKQDGFDVVL
jgi:two-component system, OmpR family, response regulator MtrA